MRFNLDDYETVESRIKKFYELYPDGRIVTEWANNFVAHEVATPATWVVRAFIYLDGFEQETNRPKATGYAFERDGTGGANQTSALENAETSAIGRALANMGLSGNKRASREEMQKVARARDWVEEASRLTDKDALRLLWAEAQAAKASQGVLDKIKEFADVVQPAGSERRRTSGSIPAGDTKKAGK
jgi:hypothetical protein